MGLINGSLQIGRSALMAHQSAMQIIGNNIANAGNPDFTRQSPRMSPIYGSTLPEGFDSGGGVKLTGIERHIDQAIEQRLRQAISDLNYDQVISQSLSRLETLYNEMTDNDLSSGLSEFFNAFSHLESNPQDSSARAVVTQIGDALARQIQTLRRDIIGVYNEMTETMTEAVSQINQISVQIAELNVSIANARSGGDPASALMDRRDTLLKSLASLTDINVVEHITGEVTVYIGSDPLVQSNQARKLEVLRKTDGDITIPEVIFSDNARTANITGGKVGAIDELIHTLIGGNLNQLDALASSLIFEINKIHSSGQGLQGYTNLTSSNAVLDPTEALNAAGLAFSPINGSFLITVKDHNTNQMTVHQIDVSLNGIGPATTLDDLAAQISAIADVSAVVLPTGHLNISTTSDNYSITFSEDSSGILASFGINSFFTGSNAADIRVNQDLLDNPRLVACGQNYLSGDGSNAGLISKLRTTGVSSLNGSSITDFYRSMIGSIGAQTASARQRLEVHAAIADSLRAQREMVSGVSLDEETINLLASQRAFQGAAKFISTVNDMLEEILRLI